MGYLKKAKKDRDTAYAVFLTFIAEDIPNAE
jgi:hypothetical protein